MSKAQFSPLIYEDLTEKASQFWCRLAVDLRYTARDGRLYVVPLGFESNLASVPWWLRWLIAKHGPWNACAVLHDWLYGQLDCSRFMADAIFRESMVCKGVGWFRRVIFFYALRIGGRSYYTGGQET